MARVVAHVNADIGDKILRKVQPALYREFERRGDNVKDAAQRNLEFGSPARYWTGDLSRSVRVRMFKHRQAFGARIGSDLDYAEWVHRGTGIYGPHATPIVPTTWPYLKFTPKGGTKALRKKSVKGMKPNPFLKDALSAAAP